MLCHECVKDSKKKQQLVEVSWSINQSINCHLLTVKASGCCLLGDVEHETMGKIWSSLKTLLIHWHALMGMYTPSDRKVPGGREQLIKAATFEQTVPCSCAWVILRSQILWDFFRIFVKENSQRKFCAYQASQDKTIRSGLREAAEHNISGRGTKALSKSQIVGFYLGDPTFPPTTLSSGLWGSSLTSNNRGAHVHSDLFL